MVRHPPYQDFASSSFEQVKLVVKNPHSSAASENFRSRQPGSRSTFPMKLHSLLESLPENETALSWQHHGRAFKIRDRDRFANEILPSCFKFERGQYASFQRQLNIYAFMRISGGPDNGAYYHPLFLRSRPELCLLMHRKNSEARNRRRSYDPSSEPDLCTLAPLPVKSSTWSDALSHALMNKPRSTSSATSQSLPEKKWKPRSSAEYAPARSHATSSKAALRFNPEEWETKKFLESIFLETRVPSFQRFKTDPPAGESEWGRDLKKESTHNTSSAAGCVSVTRSPIHAEHLDTLAAVDHSNGNAMTFIGCDDATEGEALLASYFLGDWRSG